MMATVAIQITDGVHTVQVIQAIINGLLVLKPGRLQYGHFQVRQGSMQFSQAGLSGMTTPQMLITHLQTLTVAETL